MDPIPNRIASARVDQKNANVVTPSLPSLRGFPSFATPVKTTATTRGMTTIRIAFMNTVPNGADAWATVAKKLKPAVPDGDTAFALRLARYCARTPVALERLAYDGAARQVRHRSDKTDGPTAGTETVDPLEFLARLTAHIPNKHQVMTRYYGYYANRVRGARRRRGVAPDVPTPVAEPVPLALREARRRWAELLRQIFEVDPLRCPHCGAEMRIVAFITAARHPA